MRKGFSLVELIIVLGITAVVGALIVPNFFGFRQRRELDNNVKELVAVLRNAQDRSISQESETPWGVYLTNPADNKGFYELFSGSSYAVSTIISRVNLSSSVQFIEPTQGSFKEIVFSPVTGLPLSSATIIMSLINNLNASTTIIINTNGQIQY